MATSRSRMLLRCTSVGCAVSTGLIDGLPEHLAQASRPDLRGLQPLERERERPFARRLARELVAPEDAVVVLVLGDVREVREVAEGPDHRDGRLDVERVEPLGQRGARRRVAVATKAHGVLPDVLDDLEDLGALVGRGSCRRARARACGCLREAARRGRPPAPRPSWPPCRSPSPLATSSRRCRLLRAGRGRAFSHCVHDNGCPVDSTTAIQRSPVVSTCLRNRVASGIGTCTKRPCHRPISISVLPAIAACTALRAMFQQ